MMFRFRNGIQNMTVCIIQYLEVDVPRTPACQCFFKNFFQEKGFLLKESSNANMDALFWKEM